MSLKIYTRILIASAFGFFLFNSVSAQINSKTMHDIQLLLQEKVSRTPAQKKMDSRLLQAVREKRGQRMAEGVTLDAANIKAEIDGRVKVDVNGEINDAFINRVRSLGGEIIYASAQYHTARVLINLSIAENIAALNEVRFIQPAVLSYTVGSGVPTAKKINDKQRAITTAIKTTKFSPVLRPSLADRTRRVKELLKKYLKEHDDYNPLVLNSGIANSQGDPSHRTDDTRNKYGYAGQGIKIGVLSDSYNHLGGAQADVLTDDLPGTGNPFGNTTPVTVVQDYNGSAAEDEGRAMLQIVHDIAPKAQLFFATGDVSEASFASNIAALRTTYGCDIVIDDLGYYDEPAFQDGIVAQAVSTVISAGGMYFSSAGNEGSVALGTAGVWQGDFNDVGSPASTVGTKTGTIHNFGSLLAGDSILTVASGVYNLQWSDPWGASTNDYDLFLVSAAGAVKASSTTVQNGTQNPYESFAPPTLAAGDRLIVFKSATAAIRAISLNTNRGTLKIATTGQTHGHSCVVDAYCVAATPATGIPFVNTNMVENFSSDGLRKIFYNADGSAITPGNVLFATNGGTVRNKPDITAADGVSTTLPSSTGLNPFYGTSAAAPHAGAIAALLKSASPSITAAQIRNILTSTALDIQTPGYDNVSGYGVIQAFQAMQALNPTPLPYINLGTATITEGSYGNGNGSVEPGETGNLVVQLNNSSLANAAGVSAIVTTTTAGVTILQGSSSYGTINSSASSSNTGTPFRFAVNSSVACGTVITFQIKINFTGGVGTVGYYITTAALGQKTLGTISSTLGGTSPTGTGYTVTSGQQTGRLSRGGTASTCAAAVANPGLTATTGSRQYDAYTFTNTTAVSACFTVTLNSANGSNLYSAAYNSSGFVPANPSTNYVAASGSSATTQTYSFTVTAATAFTVVVHDVNVTPASNSPYTLSVTYTSCAAGPTCTPVTVTTSTIASGSKGAPYVQHFSAAGGSGSYIYSLTGNLPAGLSFAGDSLSGTPTQAGNFAIMVTASDPTGCPGGTTNYNLIIAGSAPASITATAGTPQTTAPSTAFSTSLKATVYDAGNTPIGGVNVIFTAPTTGASGTFAGGVSTVTVVTDANGIATAPTFTANATTGSYIVTATVNGVSTPANFNLNNVCLSTIVTSNADSGPGSLRYIIANACPASTVTFDPSVTSITLTTGEIPLTQSVTINGPGANLLAISGNNLSRIFNITAGSSTISISGLTIRDGKPQAGSLTSNSQNGGGGILLFTGILNLTNCVITNNDASLTGYAEGGGLDNEGAGLVTITGCSITNNKAQEDGGGLTQFGTARMTITSSTISGNVLTGGDGTLGGGGIFVYGLMTLTNSTVYGNTGYNAGGNIYKYTSTLTMGNTIVAGGALTAGTAANGIDILGTVSSQGYNLIQNVGGYTLTGTTTNNLVGVNPNLLSLANNGGTTPTLLPMANSPAINTGNTALLSSATDQRGLARVVGGRADIGAVEANGYTFYYSKSSGTLDQLATWGTNTDGTGTAPISFTADNQIFTVQNNAAPAIANNWTVSGISSLLVGDGTNATVVTVASGKTFTIGSSTSMTNQINSSMIFSPASNFTTGPGSSVNFNGKSVTFKSSVTGTANLAQISGTLSNATNVTVERYISSLSNRAYRLLGSSVTTTSTIRANWQEGTNNPNTSTINNPVPTYGTQITGSSTGANGFDATQSGQASLFTFNQATQAYVAAANTGTAVLNAKTGYLLYIRGDRSIDLTSQSSPLQSSNTTLRATGTLLTGTQTFAGLASNDFSLVTNPYASAVNWNLIYNHAGTNNVSSFSNYYTYLDPNIGSRGGYVTVTDGGTVSPTPVSGLPAGTINIQSGQAFFVNSTTASPTLTIQESDKSTTNNIDVFRTTTPASQKFTTSLYYNDAEHGRRLADGVTSLYDDSYNKNLDGNDAEEIPNWDENIAIAREGKYLSIEERPTITAIDTLSLYMSNMKQQSYEFEFNPTGLNPNTVAVLMDNYTGGKTYLDVTAKTVVPFSVTSAAASSATDRFYILFKTSGALPVTLTKVKAYQKNAVVQVEWTTQQENNIDRYEVERSQNGQQFNKIGAVNATGNSSSITNYSLFDAAPFNGVNYYRIKIIDRSGQVTYSAVVKVNISSKANQITVAPNPVHSNTVMVQMNNMQKGSYTISLTNKLGQVIALKVIDHAGGSTTESVTPSKVFAAGVYQLKVTGNGISVIQQVLKD